MDFLIFQLYGPMASWGDIAVGEIRSSQDHPSKSALSGLLAGAFGIDRNNEEKKHLKIDQDYGTAICMRLSGESSRDFQTVQCPSIQGNSRREELLKKLNTVLSYRDFYMDAFYQIAIWKKREKTLFSLEEIKQALLEPCFPLYLGRKSHPLSLPVYPLIFLNVNLKQAFEKYPLDKGKEWIDQLSIEKSTWNSELDKKMSSSSVRYFWEEDLLPKDAGMKSDMVISKRDRVFSRNKWLFVEREEYCKL